MKAGSDFPKVVELRKCSQASCVPLSLDATRRRAFGLVSQAYTSIVADDFAAFVGLPVEEAVKGTWHYSLSTFYTDDRGIHIL